MNDHFLRLSEDALDDSRAGERLILCRKAAEAFCKAIAKDGFPDRVGSQLSRMIDYLFSQKLLDPKIKALLDVIRIWTNLESHDNPSSELSLSHAIDCMKELRAWYKDHYLYNVASENAVKAGEADSAHIRFKYYQDSHKNLKDQWFDGAKTYQLLGLSDEALLLKWHEFLLTYVITLEEFFNEIESEKRTREKMILMMSVDSNYLREVESFWGESELTTFFKSQISQNFFALFKQQGSDFRTQVTSSNISLFCELCNICEEYCSFPQESEFNKIIFDIAETFVEQEVFKVLSLSQSILEMFSPDQVVLCVQDKYCEKFAICLYETSVKSDLDYCNQGPVVCPTDCVEQVLHGSVVDEILFFEDEALRLQFPKEMWKLLCTIKEITKAEIQNQSNVILEIDLLAQSSLNHRVLENFISDEILSHLSTSYKRFAIISKLFSPCLFNSEIEDGNFYQANDQSDANAYFNTAAKIANFVNFSEDKMIVDLPLNLSKAVSRILIEEVERSANQSSNAIVSRIFVRATDLPEELDVEVDEFLNSFNIFLECFSPYPFPRACIVGNVKEGRVCSPWIYTTSLEEAEYEIKQSDPPVKTEDQDEQCKLVLTKSGLLFKIDSLHSFLNQYDNPGEILLLEDTELDSLFFYFSENGRCYSEISKFIPWYPTNTTAHDAMQVQQEEKIIGAMEIKDFDSGESVVLCTANGVIKKSQLAAYNNLRKGGIIGINIDDGDFLRHAVKIKPKDDILIITQSGKGLKFSSDQLRDQGRVTRGVRGISLEPDDEVESILVMDDSKFLLLVDRNGLAIRVRNLDFPPRGDESEDGNSVNSQKRGGSGIIAMETASIGAALNVDSDSEILVVTEKGKTTICPVGKLKETNIGSKGERLVDIDSGDAVQSVFLVP